MRIFRKINLICLSINLGLRLSSKRIAVISLLTLLLNKLHAKTNLISCTAAYHWGWHTTHWESALSKESCGCLLSSWSTKWLSCCYAGMTAANSSAASLGACDRSRALGASSSVWAWRLALNWWDWWDCCSCFSSGKGGDRQHSKAACSYLWKKYPCVLTAFQALQTSFCCDSTQVKIKQHFWLSWNGPAVCWVSKAPTHLSSAKSE